MDCIELIPSLSHCIETTAREEFWNSVNKYMQSGQEDKELEAKIELLKAFLESMDFKKAPHPKREALSRREDSQVYNSLKRG